jgi:hypothetical protein
VAAFVRPVAFIVCLVWNCLSLAASPEEKDELRLVV